MLNLSIISRCQRPLFGRNVAEFKQHTHLAHLADTASLAKRADSPHITLVPGAKLGRIVVGRRIQGKAGVYFPGCLQVVVLTKQRE